MNPNLRTPLLASAALVAALLALSPAPAHAHPLSPIHLRIVEHDLHLELTLTHDADTVPPRLTPPPHCRIEPLAPSLSPTTHVARARWHCPLAGPLVAGAGPDTPPLVVEIVGRGDSHGTSRVAVLDARHPVLDLGAPEDDALTTFASWLFIGAAHLAFGLDHLFLVIGLVLLIGLNRRLVFALTAFTLGHSLSLALGVHGLVALPGPLVESAVALTLVALALELASPRPDAPGGPRPPLIARLPWLTGVALGLVHGLGFAGALAELTLPDAHAALALVAFNLGLELAQLAVVLACALVLALTRPRPLTMRRTSALAGWIIGIAGAAWLIERVTMT